MSRSHEGMRIVSPGRDDVPFQADKALQERRGRALLHWVNGPDVRPLFYTSAVTSPASPDSFWEMWMSRRAGAGIEPVVLSGILEPLPAELVRLEADIRASEQFRNVYEPLGAQFVAVTVDNLVTPQWWVDADHVDELAHDLPDEDDLEELFHFCFAPGSVDPPLMLGMNGAMVTSRKRGLGMISPLRVGSIAPDKITFEFDALPRPNWLLLSMVPENGSILVVNGVHHVAALQRGGRPRAIALILGSPLPAIMNFQEPGIFKPERLLSGRPPLVRDFFNPGIADDVRIRALEQFMRFGVQNPPEIGFVPQSRP